jgi:hypothetical protein
MTFVNRFPESYFGLRAANQFREIENRAAIKIQSWYRGLRTRSYLR